MHSEAHLIAQQCPEGKRTGVGCVCVQVRSHLPQGELTIVQLKELEPHDPIVDFAAAAEVWRSLAPARRKLSSLPTEQSPSSVHARRPPPRRAAGAHSHAPAICAGARDRAP